MQNRPGERMEMLTRNDKNMTELNYNWSIENFASLMNNNVGQGLVSGRFSIDNTLWHFILHPNGSNQDSRHFVSLWIFNDNQEEFSIEYRVFIGEQLLNSSGVNLVAPGQRQGILKLVSHIEILEKNLMDQNGHLNLTIKLSKEMEVFSESLGEYSNGDEMKKILVHQSFETEIESPKRFIKLRRNEKYSKTSLPKDPLEIEPRDTEIKYGVRQLKEPNKITLNDPNKMAFITNSPKTYSKKLSYPATVSKSTTNIKSESYSPKTKILNPVISNSAIDLPSISSALPPTTIPLPFHEEDSFTTPSHSVSRPNNKSSFIKGKHKNEVIFKPMNPITGLSKKVADEASPDEPVGELLKIVINLPLGDKVLFLKLLVLQLNDDMLSMIKKMVNTLEQEKAVLEDSSIDLTMKITEDDSNDGEYIKDVYKELDEHIDMEDISNEIDRADDINECIDIVEHIDEIHQDSVKECQLDLTEVNLKKVDVRIKKLSVEVEEGINVTKKDSTLNGEVSNSEVEIKPEKPRKFGCNDIRENEGDNCQNKDKDIVEDTDENPKTTIIKELIENYVPSIVDFDHPYALKVEKASTQENGLAYFRVIVNNDRLYTCCHPKCDKIFKTAGELRKHKNRHIDLENIVKRDFKKLLSVSGKSLIICDQCPQTFKTKGGWREHQKRHDEETSMVKNIQCDECEMRFCSSSMLRSHIKKKHSEVVCDKCGHTCRNEHHLKIHDVTKHSDPTKPRPYPCDQCQSAFYVKSLLTKHKKMHNGGKRFSCDQCKKSFYCNWELNEHKAAHGNERKHKCKECNKTFKFSSTLYKHIKTRHTLYLPHECDVCLKRFSIPTYLRQHRKKHFEETKFSCDRCGSTFKQKGGLVIHLKNACPGIHEGKKIKTTVKEKKEKKKRSKKPYKPCEIVECDVCGKSLRRKNLRNHLLSHSSERPYSCKQCDQSFATKHNLNQHVLIHSKSFHCDQCRKSFSRPADLKYHLRTHTGEKPYICDQCSKPFALKGSLKKHKEKYHDCKIEVTTPHDNIIEATDNMWLYQAISTIPL